MILYYFMYNAKLLQLQELFFFILSFANYFTSTYLIGLKKKRVINFTLHNQLTFQEI